MLWIYSLQLIQKFNKTIGKFTVYILSLQLKITYVYCFLFYFRKAIEKLLHNLLVSECVGPSLISPILPCLQKIHSSTDLLVNYLTETISEIREPITLVETKLSSEKLINLDKKVIFHSIHVLFELFLINMM